MNRSLKLFAFALVVSAQATNLWACPMCKYALETDEPEPKAYMFSILFMIGTITTLFVAVAGLLWYVTKLEKMNLNAAGYQHLFENGGSQPHLATASKSV